MLAQIITKSASILALAAAVLVTGCGDTKTPDSKTKTIAKNDQPKNKHPAHGPHHGHLFELTPEGFQHVHVEIVEDDDANKVVAYLLDAELDKEVPSSAPEATIEITADGEKKSYTLKGEMKDGKASSYSSSDPELSKAIDAKGAKLAFRVEIDGKRYNATVQHVMH